MLMNQYEKIGKKTLFILIFELFDSIYFVVSPIIYILYIFIFIIFYKNIEHFKKIFSQFGKYEVRLMTSGSVAVHLLLYLCAFC